MASLQENYYINGPTVVEYICKYNYSSWNYSIGARVLRVLVDKLLDVTPTNLAPNVITILNFAIICFTFSLFLLTHENFVSKEEHPYIFLFQGFGFILYQILDCLDGQQARKLFSENALGEFLDHGVDQLSAYLSVVIGLCILQGGESYFSLFTIFLLSSLVCLVTFDAMITLVLTQGQLFSGVEFHVIYAAGGCFIISFFGKNAFEYEVFSIKIKYFIMIVFLLAFFSAFFGNSAVQLLREKSIVLMGKTRDEALMSVIPLLVFMIMFWFLFLVVQNFCLQNIMLYGSVFMLGCVHFQLLCIAAKICRRVPKIVHSWHMLIFLCVIGYVVGCRLFGVMNEIVVYWILVGYLGIILCCITHCFIVSCCEIMDILDAGFFDIVDTVKIRKEFKKKL